MREEALGRHRKDAAEEEALHVHRGSGGGPEAQAHDPERERHGEEDAGGDVGPQPRLPPHERGAEGHEHDEGQGHRERLVDARPQEQAQGQAAEGRMGQAVREERQAALDHEQAQEAARRADRDPGQHRAAQEGVGERIEKEVHAQSSSHTAASATAWSCPKGPRGMRPGLARSVSGEPEVTTVPSR